MTVVKIRISRLCSALFSINFKSQEGRDAKTKRKRLAQIPPRGDGDSRAVRWVTRQLGFQLRPDPASLAISLGQLPQRGFACRVGRGLQRGWVVSHIRRCVYVCVCFGSACSVCSGTQQLRPDGIRDGVGGDRGLDRVQPRPNQQPQ